MKPLFKSSGYLPKAEQQFASDESLDFEQLPPFLRVLLSTDGTVTKSLESFFWERVNVEDVKQHKVTLDKSLDNLAQPAGYPLLEREVCLIGENSGRVYAHAQSLICIDALPKQLAIDLEEGRLGIGELMRDGGLESYREILSCGQQTKTEWGGDQVWRCYLIVINSEPVIQVTEWFPVELFLTEQSITLS